MFKCYILAFALCKRILPFSQTCYTGKYLEYRKKMYVSHSTPIWAEIVSQYFIYYFAAQIFFVCTIQPGSESGSLPSEVGMWFT